MEDKELKLKAENQLSTIRVGASWVYPMISRGLFAMKPVIVLGLKESSGGAVWAMDKNAHIYVDPRALVGPDKESIEASIASFIHETWHWLMLHPERLERLSPSIAGKKVCQKRANIAMDMAINGGDPYLRKHLHEYNVWPEKYTDTRTGLPFGRNGGLSWEEYYKFIDWEEEEEEESSEPPGGGDGGDTPDEGRPSEGDSPEDKNPNDVGNGENPWEISDDEENFGLGEAQEIRKAVARNIEESSKTRGTPKGWSAWASQEIEEPKISWEEQLRRFVEDSHESVAGCSNFTYSKRSRRQGLAGSNVIIPAVYRPKCEVAVVIDTSGSMSDSDLKSCVEETSGILDAMGASAMVVTGDTHVGFAEKISDITDISLFGRGGTNMCPMIRRAMEEPEIQAVIVMTDGYTPWVPEDELRVPAVVCLIGRHCGEESVPNYMTTIVVED